MKKASTWWGVVFTVVVLVAGLAGPVAAETDLERPGAYYWGDSGSSSMANGTITSLDQLALNTKLYGGDPDYSGCYPPSYLVQDLDGNGSITTNDRTVLGTWLLGNWSAGDLGRPASIEILTPDPGLYYGETLSLSVKLLDSGGGFDGDTTPRWGFGVVFEITGGCQNGIILSGLDPTPVVGGGRNQIIQDTKVFGYTDLEGVASVEAAVTTAECVNQTVEVSVYVPGDVEAGIMGGRLPTTLQAADNPIVMTTYFPCCIQIPGTLACDLSAVSENQTLAYHCTMDLEGGGTEDVTAATTVSGDCTGGAGTITGNDVPGGADPAGAGAIEYDAESPQPVTVINDDTLVSTLISCPASVDEGQSFSCTTTETWSDSSTSDATAGQASAGNCTGSDGSFTAGQIPCGAGGSCTVSDAADNSPVAVTVANDDSVAAVDVAPEGPVYLSYPASQVFSCTATYTDSCTESCDGALTDDPGCGSLSGVTYYSVDVGCTDNVSATYGGHSDSETVNVGACCIVCTINAVFPLDFSDRFRLNAHAVDQKLTVITTNGASAMSATCSAAGHPDVNLSCALRSGSATDYDCTPTSEYDELTTYTCSVDCFDDTSVGSMTTSSKTVGTNGSASHGYVGGLTYDSAVGEVAPGLVDITAVNPETDEAIAGNVYVQIIQGATLREYFTQSDGTLTAALDPLPIDQVTLGYKCGALRCDKDSASDSYHDFQYVTYNNVDASTLRLPLRYMSDSEHQGRNRAKVMGQLTETTFSRYIGPRPRPMAQKFFSAPVKLRAALVLQSFAGSAAPLTSGLDGILMPADGEISLALCLSTTGTVVSYTLKATMPPNLVMPDLIRANWTAPCDSWTNNAGNFTYTTNFYTPNTQPMVWTLGVWINFTNFSVLQHGSNQIDFLSFPLSVCAMGYSRVTIPASLTGGPTTINLGTAADLSQDLRENWTNSGLGYDYDGAVDRKVLFSMSGDLPIDPARAGARTAGGWAYNGYRHPNGSDSALGSGWANRFYRKSVTFVSGADYGPEVGLGITGLGLSSKIHDPQFTVFNVQFSQSVYPKVGVRDLRYWANAGPAAHTVSDQQAAPSSSWTDPKGLIDFSPTESGGPSNYAVIAVLSRGRFTDTKWSDFSIHSTDEVRFGTVEDFDFNPGSIVSVYHVGPFQNTTVVRIPDFLQMMSPVSPVRDAYIYPGPQFWGNTLSSGKVNRNGEMWPDRTVSSTNVIQTDSSDPWNRYKIEFTNPGMYHATARSIHSWEVSFSEASLATFNGSTVNGWYAKASKLSPISSDAGYAYVVGSTQWFENPNYPYNPPRFLAQGVQAGDSLWINSDKYNVFNTSCYINLVQANRLQIANNKTACNFASGPLANHTDILYRVIRANPQGECLIDPGFAGGPQGYGCNSNTFWTSVGPTTAVPGVNIKTHFPKVVTGSRTLQSTTGVVSAVAPDPLDGLPPGAQLQWKFAIYVYNTSAVTLGGMGRKFDWNNRDFTKTQLYTEHAATDRAFFIYQ